MKRAINPALVRIILRYGAGALAAYSIVPQEITDAIATDPDVAGLIALALAGGVEGYYALAKRFGWRT